MRNKSKYIVAERIYGPIAIVFSDDLNHSDVAHALFSGLKILGAGFCFTENDKYQVYGESLSLKVSSRPKKDADALNYSLGATTEL